ncbi:MAG: S66 peptidase family protein [Bacteroidia bacterium]
MILPPYLREGDRIGLFAPARKIRPEDGEKAAGFLRSWGLIPVFGKNLFKESNQFAGVDRERASDLHDLLMDDSIKAILAFRGGYGSVRLLPYLEKSYPTPKWIIGYSDLTVLHTWANQRLGWASIHATMPVNMIEEGEDRIRSANSLRQALFGSPESITLPAHTLNAGGNASGILCGGNLSVLYSLLGSDLQLDSAGKLLFLEDLDEYLYHVDRMMQAINRSGIGTKAAAWLIGGMSEMRDNAIPFGFSAEEIIGQAHLALSSPLRFGVEAGHIPLNRAMIFGMNYQLGDGLLTPLP